jgi:hypothetical protein
MTAGVRASSKSVVLRWSPLCCLLVHQLKIVAAQKLTGQSTCMLHMISSGWGGSTSTFKPYEALGENNQQCESNFTDLPSSAESLVAPNCSSETAPLPEKYQKPVSCALAAAFARCIPEGSCLRCTWLRLGETIPSTRRHLCCRSHRLQ